jgi:hypothetical protein
LDGGGDEDDVVDLLVGALRRHTEQMADAHPEAVPGLVAALEGAGYGVFHRLALHLLARDPGRAPELVRGRILDPARFDEEEIRPEYDALVGAAFPLLAREEQAHYLGWVEEGLRGMALRSVGAEALPTDLGWTGEDEDRWTHDRLAPVSRSLPAAWADRFDSVMRRIAAAEAERRPAAVPTAPQLAAEGVLEMETGEIIRAAELGHTETGTALPPAALAEAVERAPDRFAFTAEQYAALPASQQVALLDGFATAARHGPAFGWGPVLSLTESLADNAAGGGHSEEWEAIIERIAGVLEQGLSLRSAVKIPPDLLESVCPTLAVLVRHTVGAHARDGEDSTRERGRVARLGRRTVDLLVHYGLRLRELRADHWVPNSIPEEVASALISYLSLPEPDAPWVRETFARQYPLLVSLDRDWAEAHRLRIFPVGPGSDAEFRRAWGAYVAGGAWGLPAQILVDEYARAIDGLADAARLGTEPAIPEQRLAWHLVSLLLQWASEARRGQRARPLLPRRAGGAPRTCLGTPCTCPR